MIMKTKMLVLSTALAITSLALAGCGSQRAAEKVVRDAMKDPESANFGEFYFNEKTQKGCLTVNGRNSMGGYTGDQEAYVEHEKDGSWSEQGIAAVDKRMCRDVFADVVY